MKWILGMCLVLLLVGAVHAQEDKLAELEEKSTGLLNSIGNTVVTMARLAIGWGCVIVALLGAAMLLVSSNNPAKRTKAVWVLGSASASAFLMLVVIPVVQDYVLG